MSPTRDESVPADSARPRPNPNAGQTEWEGRVLYYQHTRTDLSNERKYLGWLRVSLGLVTLGFVVERLDLFLARSSGVQPQQVSGVLRWAPIVIFGMGIVTIAVTTWEFFADRSP